MCAQNTVSPVEQDRQVEGAILGLLLDAPVLWSTLEIEREIGAPLATTDALVRLHRAGLVNRVDSFVFASRSAARAAALCG